MKHLRSVLNIERRMNFSIAHVTSHQSIPMILYFVMNLKLWCTTTMDQAGFGEIRKRLYKIIPLLYPVDKFSFKVWGCVPAEGVGRLRVFKDMMTNEYYIEILKRKFPRSATKFHFFDFCGYDE